MATSSKFRLRVLFVDDDASISDRMEKSLPRRGFDTVVCRDAPEALRAIRDQTFDAAVVDLRMPGGSGWDIIEELRESMPCCEYVISTGHGEVEEVLRALRMGAVDFLPKPASLVEIETCLNQIAEKKQLENKTQALEGRLRRVEGRSDLIGESGPMQRVHKLIERVAPSDSAVLILGETGTGKEMVARRIHEMSERRDAPFVAVNCGAIPEHLVESEFFGHRKGAFTGADSDRKGLFEVASGGTLFLDELGELEKSMQVKLLRFLENGEVRRVGDNEAFRVDVRILCATNRDLQDMVAEGQFREDLMFRVNTFEVYLPPLRERTGDILPLSLHLIARHLKRDSVPPEIISKATLQVLEAHDWSGNVRELANVLEHAVILSEGRTIEPDDLPRSVSRGRSIPMSSDVRRDSEHADSAMPTFVGRTITLREMEAEMILYVLDKHNGDKRKAAAELGIALKTLYNRLAQLDTARDAG